MSADAAVDRQQLAGDAGGEVAREEERRVRDLVDRRDAAERGRAAGGRERLVDRDAALALARRRIRASSASVAIGPGAIALTRMPRRPRSSAAERTSPSTACLLAV